MISETIYRQIGNGSQGVRLMKKWITIILAVCLSAVLTACSLGNMETQTASEETAKNPNVLIVYYSDSDIMGHVAEAIASKTGGRIVEIRRSRRILNRPCRLPGKKRLTTLCRLLPQRFPMPTAIRPYSCAIRSGGVLCRCRYLPSCRKPILPV